MKGLVGEEPAAAQASCRTCASREFWRCFAHTYKHIRFALRFDAAGRRQSGSNAKERRAETGCVRYIAFSHLLHSYSAGLTLRAGGFPMVYLMYAWGGHEGTHTIVNVNTSLLGGADRPSLY
jgi:hypothetical protein